MIFFSYCLAARRKDFFDIHSLDSLVIMFCRHHRHNFNVKIHNTGNECACEWLPREWLKWCMLLAPAPFPMLPYRPWELSRVAWQNSPRPPASRPPPKDPKYIGVDPSMAFTAFHCINFDQEWDFFSLNTSWLQQWIINEGPLLIWCFRTVTRKKNYCCSPSHFPLTNVPINPGRHIK